MRNIIQILCVAAIVVLAASTAQAGTHASGDVIPADPATWTSSTNARIGNSGFGSLNIEYGGYLVSSRGFLGFEDGGVGEVSVSGQGSIWTDLGYLFVGENGKGTLEITDGGSVSSRYGFIGNRPGSTGTVMIRGQGSAWKDMGHFTVGENGKGELEIIAGGSVSSRYGFIGKHPGSMGTAVIRGQGSAWTDMGYFFIGEKGEGELILADGGSASSRYGGLGHLAGSIGTATVSGQGSMLANFFRFHVGQDGDGRLNILNGGLVRVDDNITIDEYGGGKSFIAMGTGGMLALRGNSAGSIQAFLGSIDGADEIRYFNESTWGWENITGATPGQDYTLDYLTGGDLTGYTVLTVTTVPEPATLSLLALGGMALIRRRRSR